MFSLIDYLRGSSPSDAQPDEEEVLQYPLTENTKNAAYHTDFTPSDAIRQDTLPMKRPLIHPPDAAACPPPTSSVNGDGALMSHAKVPSDPTFETSPSAPRSSRRRRSHLLRCSAKSERSPKTLNPAELKCDNGYFVDSDSSQSIEAGDSRRTHRLLSLSSAPRNRRGRRSFFLCGIRCNSNPFRQARGAKTRAKERISRSGEPNLYPMAWMLQVGVKNLIDAISFQLVGCLATWLLQKSLIGDKSKQVFRKPKGLGTTTSPINVRALEYKRSAYHMYLSDDEDGEEEKSETSETKDINTEAEMTSGQNRSPVLLMNRMPDQTKKLDLSEVTSTSFFGAAEHNQNLNWAVTTIEFLAIIPIVIVGLSLFYILIVGLCNDVSDLIQPFFGENEEDANDMSNYCPYHHHEHTGKI